MSRTSQPSQERSTGPRHVDQGPLACHHDNCPHATTSVHPTEPLLHDEQHRSPGLLHAHRSRSTTSAREEDFLAAIDETIKYFNDGDIVEGTIVKVDRDEVLLDIGYKTEGVIPSRELSIKHDVDPNEVVTVGDKVEALVLQKEDKEGRLILSKKRAQYERAWGTIEKIKEEDGVVTGTVIEVVKGGLILDIGLRGFLPASLVEMRRVRDLQPYVGKELEAKIIELDKNRNNVVLSRRAWLEQTQSEVRHDVPHPAPEGPDPQRRRLLDRQLRCVRRPRRRRRPGARLRAVLEAHRPPVRGRRGRPGGHRRGARRRHGPRARLAVAEGDPGGPVAAVRPDPPDRPDRAGQGHQAGAVRLRSSASRRASRAWCTSPSWPSATWRSPSRSSRSTTTSWSRSSTSTSSVAASRCRSSRPTRASASEADDERLRPDALRHGRDLRRARATTSTPRASTPRPASGSRATRSSRPTWEQQYAEAHARWEAHMKQVVEAQKAEAEAGVEAGDATSYSSEAPRRPTRPRTPAPAARWPPTRRCRRCARSSPAADPPARPARPRTGSVRGLAAFRGRDGPRASAGR